MTRNYYRRYRPDGQGEERRETGSGTSRNPNRDARASQQKGRGIMSYSDPIGPRVVGYNLSSQTYAYMMRMIDLGIFEGAVGEMDLAPGIQEIIEALHHVVAGGEVKMEVVRRGNPDIVNELNRRIADGMREANEINERSGYYVTAAA